MKSDDHLIEKNKNKNIQWIQISITISLKYDFGFENNKFKHILLD